METTKETTFAAEIFDTFVQICNKYKINFDGATAIKTDIPAKVKKPAGTKIKRAKRITAPTIKTEFVKWFVKTPAAQLYAVKRDQWQCALVKGVYQLLFKTASPMRSYRSDDSAAGSILAFKSNKEVTFVNAGRFNYQGSTSGGVSLPQQIAMDNGAMPVPLRLIMASKEPEPSAGGRAPQSGIGANVEDIEVIDWGGQETFKVLRPRWNYRQADKDKTFIDRHFAGAMLLKIKDGKYLIDVDRNEIKAFNFLSFFTNLPETSKATTIKQAYDDLVDPDLKDRPYIRQGELFFTPVDDSVVKAKACINAKNTTAAFQYENIMSLAKVHAICDYNTEIKNRNYSDTNTPQARRELTHEEGIRWDAYLAQSDYALAGITKAQIDKGSPTEAELSSRLQDNGVDCALSIKLNHNIQLKSMTNGQSHTASLLLQDGDDIYVYGYIHHREHKGLLLDGWHKVYRNTATRNWNVSGEID